MVIEGLARMVEKQQLSLRERILEIAGEEKRVILGYACRPL